MKTWAWIGCLTAVARVVDGTPSLILPRATCTTPSGNGTCIPISSCDGTSLPGYCSGSGNDIQCCVRTCTTPSGPGFCENSSGSCTNGHFVSGYCPGSSKIQCCVASCSTSKGNGYCAWNSGSCLGGRFIAGACPGPSDVQCCVAPCSTPSGNGNCQYTSGTCSNGNYFAGYCPGGSDYQCCLKGGTAPSGTGLPGIDISESPPSSFWPCATQNYKVVVIRGYIQGCRIGGEVDVNFVSTYNAAVAAGIPRIDSYMFPCTGTQLSTDHACKSPATQMSEYLAAIDDNNLNIDTLWLDIEQTNTANGEPCNAWNLGKSGNLALAQQWVSLMRSSGRKWGIYANGNTWADMFPSRSTDIASDLPYWSVQKDYTPGVNTVTTFCGGWTTASAKQYDLDTSACGWGPESVDLDSFL